MSSKKILFVTIGIFILVCLGIAIVSCNNTNYAESYEATINVDSAGNINIQETMVVNFKSYLNYVNRDLGLSKNLDNNPLLNGINFDNNEGTLRVNDVKVFKGNINEGDAKEMNDIIIRYSFNNDKDRHGNLIECPFNESYCPSACESIYVDANEDKFEGILTFYYDYTIEGMVTKYSDCAELNYVLFNYLGFKTKKASVKINIPSSTHSEDELFGYVHSQSSGSYKQVGNNSFEIIAKNIADDDKLEFRVVFPEDIVFNISEENTIDAQMKTKILDYENKLSEETASLHRKRTIFIAIVIILIAALVAITIVVYVRYDKEFTPKFDNEYYRELPYNYPPAIMSYLYYFQKTVDEDFTATVLNLIRRKYLELTCLSDMSDRNANYELKLGPNDTCGLMEHEKKLLDLIINIIGDGEKVTFEEIENYGDSYKNAEKFNKETGAVRKTIETDSKNFDFFIDTRKAKAKVAIYGLLGLVIGFILLFVDLVFNLSATEYVFVLFAASIIYLIYIASIKKRSVNGNEEYAKWKAFKHFLCDFGTLKDYSVEGIDLWEEYLVYATSLKVADRVMEQLKVKLPEISSNDSTYLSTSNNNYFVNLYLYNRLGRVYSNARMTSYGTIAAHNARNSGGSGHGGGFSGGSSFGGGGGGFRGGR